MCILILANSDSGLIQFRKELINSLLKNNKVVCCVPNSDGFVDRLKDLGCEVIITDFKRRSKNPIDDIRLLKKYVCLINQTKPTVVLTYTIKPNIYGGLACQLTRTPYIANVTGLGTSIENGGILSKVSIFLYRVGLRKCNCVFFQNKYNKDFFQKKHVVSKNNRLIPGSGVNTRTHYLEEYPPDGSQFRFLFVGRVMRDKGIEELLTAIKQLSADNLSVILDVVGPCDKYYSEILTDYEIKGLIKYHGKQNDVHSFYANSHCVVLPSYHEGMANVMLEAASTGRPVITTTVPGCRETFEEGRTGYGCEAKSTNSLIVAMKKMIVTPWNERREMGLAGREKVIMEFDRDFIIQSYTEELDKILHEN